MEKQDDLTKELRSRLIELKRYSKSRGIAEDVETASAALHWISEANKKIYKQRKVIAMLNEKLRKVKQDANN